MKNFIENIYYFFIIGSCNYPYSEIHDKALNMLLDKHRVTNIGYFNCFLGDTKIWIANMPYAVGISLFKDLGTRPSRKTIYRLKKLIEKERVLSLNREQVRLYNDLIN